jgi:hypothetical protein
MYAADAVTCRHATAGGRNPKWNRFTPSSSRRNRSG